MIGVENFNDLTDIIHGLESLGYKYFAEANVPGRFYFRFRGE